MIEAIINYIRKAGFIVDVRERVLVIRRYVDGQLLSMSRAIALVELESIDEGMAEFIAESWIQQFWYGARQKEQASGGNK